MFFNQTSKYLKIFWPKKPDYLKIFGSLYYENTVSSSENGKNKIRRYSKELEYGERTRFVLVSVP